MIILCTFNQLFHFQHSLSTSSTKNITSLTRIARNLLNYKKVKKSFELRDNFFSFSLMIDKPITNQTDYRLSWSFVDNLWFVIVVKANCQKYVFRISGKQVWTVIRNVILWRTQVNFLSFEFKGPPTLCRPRQVWGLAKRIKRYRLKKRKLNGYPKTTLVAYVNQKLLIIWNFVMIVLIKKVLQLSQHFLSWYVFHACRNFLNRYMLDVWQEVSWCKFTQNEFNVIEVDSANNILFVNS